MAQRIAAALAAALIVSACASSLQSTYKAAAADAGEGISYYLPKRLVRLTVERKQSTLDRAALAAAYQTAKSAEAEARKMATEKEVAFDTAKRAHQAAIDAGLDSEALKPLATARTAAENAYKVAQKALELRSAETSAAAEKLNAPIPELKKGDKLYEETARLALLDPIPDIDQRFVAKLNHHWSRDDDWLIDVSAAGLLSGATSNPDGKADEIITEISKTVLALASPGGLVPPSKAVGLNIFKSTAEDQKFQQRDTADNKCQTNEFTFRYELEFDPTSLGEAAINKSLTNLCSSFRVEFAAPATRSSVNQETALRGLAYRRGRPVTFTLKKFRGGADLLLRGPQETDFEPHQSATFMIPNGSPVEVLPFEPSAISKQKMTAKFDNGMLTQADFEKPSEGAALAQIPATVVKGAFGLTGELLTLRINNTKSQASSFTAEKDAIDELKKLLEAQRQLEEIKAKLKSGASAE